jgi:hypothetical protein
VGRVIDKEINNMRIGFKMKLMKEDKERREVREDYVRICEN